MKPAATLRFGMASLGFALSVSSCAGHKALRIAEEEDPVCVSVENYNFFDVWVYVERDGTRFRLGRVDGMNTKELPIPNRILGGVWKYRLIADPVGSTEFAATPELEIIPGCRTHWALGQNLSVSMVFIR